MRLKNAQILLTGGRGGLGRALSEQLRGLGAHVRTAGIDQGEDMWVDFSDPTDITRFCRDISALPVDILINNAGLQHFGRTHEQSDISVHKMVTVNLEAPLQVTRTVLPGMLARGRGQIVNIGSVFAGIPFPHFSVYSATKSGLRAFSQSIRREYAGQGITVTYVAPRALKTAMSAGAVYELLKRTRSAMDAPEIAAGKIAVAIERDRREFSLGLPESVFTRINALLPGIVDQALTKARNIGNELLTVPKI